MGVSVFRSGNYSCLRVSRGVGGKVRQAYFRLEERESAERLDAQWKIDQDLARAERIRQAKPSARATDPSRTSVRGIQLVVERKPRPYRIFFLPRFYVCAGGGRSGVCRVRTVYLGSFDYDLQAAWQEAVRAYAEMKGISPFDHLLKRPAPTQEQLREVLEAAGVPEDGGPIEVDPWTEKPTKETGKTK